MPPKPPRSIRWSDLLDDLTGSKHSRSIVIERTTETERMAIFLLRRDHWSVKSVSGTRQDYDLELYKFGERVAAKVVNQRNKVTLSQIEGFIDFLANKSNGEFTGGICISTNGFTDSVYSFLRDENIQHIKLAILDKSELHWNCEELDRARELKRPVYIGVFTCKGGVGKTTIAAHLAGALALNGYDISLIDLDQQQNLSKLLGNGVYLPSREGIPGSRISVGNAESWRNGSHDRTKYVVCDCSPELEANPLEFIRRFDFCIVPTNLSPLGINKNADVIKRTFELIRAENTSAGLFVLINSLQADEPRRNQLLNDVLKTQFKDLSKSDPNCHYIDPGEVAIRFSKQLLYWGYHIFDGSKPTLSFNSRGQYSYPRMDFLKLVDYLESTTELRSREKSLAAML